MEPPSIASCKFVPPSLNAWIYAVSVHGACCVLGALPIGALLYFIRSRCTTTARVALSVAIGIATAASVPLWIVPLLYVEGPIHWVGPFLASTFGFATFFKSINAGLGQFPAGADADLTTWLMWFILMPEPQFSKTKLRQASREAVWNRIRYFVYKIAGLFVVLSILLYYTHTGYRIPFSGGPRLAADHVNGYLHLWLIYLFASLCIDFSAVANVATTGGVQLEPGFLNPLLESRSLREAWGRRWNLPVQVLLLRTIYIPARRQAGWSRGWSTFWTFVASGWLHEYIFFTHNRIAYQPFHALLFFSVMGLVMIGEAWIWEKLVPRQVQRALQRTPALLISVAVSFLVAGVFESLFVPSWLDAGFVEALAEMLPHVECS